MKTTLLLLSFFLSSGFLKAQNPVIILSDTPNAADARAAAILQYYLQKISTKQVAIEVKPTEFHSNPVVYIGPSKAAKRRSFKVPNDLPDDAFYLEGKNNAFAIAGGGKMGTEYGVYSFLELLGVRQYSPRDSFIPEIKDLQLPIYAAKTENPAFSYRELWYEPAFDEGWARWHKLKTNPRKNEEWGMFVHTFHKLCPSEEYFAEHPEYFSFNGAQRSDGQLCLSNDSVLQIVLANLAKFQREKPLAKYWSISQNDNYDFCKCPRCAAQDRYYGSPAGTLLAFVNQIAESFPKITISTLAYQYTRKAPKNIKPAANVSVCLCSIECNRGQSIETGCPDFAQDVRAWSLLTNNLMIWDYVVQFRSYISPFPNWHTLQPNLQFFQQQGVSMMFEQGSGRDCSEFSDMRAYLLAKLMWNPKADMDSILTDFGNGYYGAARPFVADHIDDQTRRLAKHGNKLWIYDVPQNEAFVKDSFFFRFQSPVFPNIDSIQQKHIASLLLTEAFSLLENLKTVPYDPEDPLSTAVNMMIQAPGILDQLLIEFKQGCETANYKHLNEQGYTPEQYIADYLTFITRAREAFSSKAQAIVLESPASNSYAKGAANELINKLVGEKDYRYNWLGFQGNDMVATVEVADESVSSVQVSFLQDQASWVFFPTNVKIEVSSDGEYFQVVQDAEIKIIPDGEKSIRKVHAEFPALKTRFVRVRALNQKTCPSWHTCNGNPCWIFADEILVR